VVLLVFLTKYSIFFNVGVSNKVVYAKSSGSFCQVVEHFNDLNISKIVLPSGLFKLVNSYNFVTLGRCSDVYKRFSFYSKAGYRKFLGKKSIVRGVAKNPVDHPHGGRTKTNSPEVSPWG